MNKSNLGPNKQFHQGKHLSKSNGSGRKDVALQVGGAIDCAVAAAQLNHFLCTPPLDAATVIGGVKGIIADGLVQIHENHSLSKYTCQRKFRFCFRRNTLCVIYNAFFPGFIAEFVYNKVFPILFGMNPSLELNLFKALFDNFIFAPLCWLPPAHMINSLILQKTSVKTGLQNHLADVQDKGLLKKYWLLWIPVQVINFTLIPAHLVVSFMASISFVWTILLSSSGSTS